MSSLRELSRQAVRTRIAEAAEALFLAKGFHETTVDEIAAAVGMSQRSFFRYFATKEDVVLEKFDRQGEELFARLNSRPLDEPDWDSLRACFDILVARLTDDARQDRVTQELIESCPALLAAQLARVNRLQEQLAERLAARALARDPDALPDTMVLRALAGAAFACLYAATSHTLHDSDDCSRLGERLDHTMGALRSLGSVGAAR
ncbi:TetR/AcrR family transcriptional regulator [Yinghuangia sp. ASG 101]|uniref:TetR/AcrR family transcriptional regulator n=1 Tax=Yinghuangia sp. ASG 101 TaxID=2896848 RepID=UPI001E2FF9C0|nr:TetR/AcrR family transcriptional regulator [Yinghuangia sp. ASG 101]UGQ12532.1 TetR/AcrR family transcriptional regulator [Yinghuangia sp. ASG 101]